MALHTGDLDFYINTLFLILFLHSSAQKHDRSRPDQHPNCAYQYFFPLVSAHTQFLSNHSFTG